jgi:tetratricopeptide (TPR) repeat protein
MLKRFCYSIGGQIAFNAAGLYMRFGQNERALSNFEQAFEQDRLFFPLSVPAGLNVGLMYLQKAASAPLTDESNHLLKARRIYKEISNTLSLNYRLNSNLPNLPQSRDFRMVMNGLGKIDASLALPRSVIDAAAARADQTGKAEDRVALARLYERRAEFELAAFHYDQLVRQNPRDFQMVLNLINTLLRFDPYRAVGLMESVYQGQLVSDPRMNDARLQFEEQIGYVNLNLAGQSLSQNDVGAALPPLSKAKDYLDRFRNSAMPMAANPEIRRRVIAAERASKQAEQQIQMIRSYLGGGN